MRFLFVPFVILIMLLFMPPVFADALYLKNGDRISGSIQSLTQQSVIIGTEYGAPLSVPMDRIDRIVQGTILWSVRKTTEGNVELVNTGLEPVPLATTQIASQATEVKTATVSESSSPEPSSAQVSDTSSAASLFEDTLGLKTEGYLRMSGNLQDGNTDKKSLSLDGQLKTELDEKQRLTFQGKYRYAEDAGVKTDDKYNIDAIYDYFFTEKWFWNNNIGYEVDKLADLDYALKVGTGLGYQPYKSDDLNLAMTLGPNFLVKEFENGTSEESMTARWTLDYNQKFYENLFKLYHRHEILQSLEESDAFIFESKTGLSVPLSKYWNGFIEMDYDYDGAPAVGAEKEDTTYAVGISYEW